MTSADEFSFLKMEDNSIKWTICLTYHRSLFRYVTSLIVAEIVSREYKQFNNFTSIVCWVISPNVSNTYTMMHMTIVMSVCVCE